MGILEVKNRTENWKTAENFCGLSDKARVSLVQKLSKTEVQPCEIRLELFWYGMRDYIHKYGGTEEALAEDFARHYMCLFANLRECIEKPSYRFKLQSHSYNVSAHENKKLFSNLRHTEIDIVLETPDHLLIGEAKDESRFGADGKHVLVHQLIRQYVMAKILAKIKGAEKKVVPFIVGHKCRLQSIKNTSQVRFMIDQDWLKECNILSWDDIKQLSQ